MLNARRRRQFPGVQWVKRGCQEREVLIHMTNNTKQLHDDELARRSSMSPFPLDPDNDDVASTTDGEQRPPHVVTALSPVHDHRYDHDNCPLYDNNALQVIRFPSFSPYVHPARRRRDIYAHLLSADGFSFCPPSFPSLKPSNYPEPKSVFAPSANLLLSTTCKVRNVALLDHTRLLFEL